MAALRADPTWEARLLAELAHRRPENDDQLHAWVQRVLGFRIARTAVCPEHQAPFQFLADLYFRRVRRAIGLGPRGGGKTTMVSILEWLRACGEKTHIFHAGGVEEQAKRGYSYVKDYVAMPHNAGLVTDSLMSATRWANGSQIEIHAATLAQLSGGHPDVKVADEVEQWGAAELQQFYGMGTGEGTQEVFISTRDQAMGLMQKLLDEAPQRHLTVYQWCIWETKSGCPECLQAACDLWPACEGKYRHSSGHRSRQNIADKYLSVDADTWEAQYLCKRPGRQGLCFPDFVSEPGDPQHSNVTEAAEFDPTLPVEVWCDDNTAQPRACLLVQQDTTERLRVFDEYYLPGRLQAQSVQDIMQRLQARGKFPERAIVPDEALELKIAWHDKDVDTASPKAYRRSQGLAITARFIRSTAGLRQLLIHPRCTNTIHSLRIAHRKKIGPDLYDEEPMKHAEDHCQDACMYGTWMHRYGD